MKHLLFGAAYYTEYMPGERIDKDMAMMKAAGFNVIRIGESTWSTVEPRPGVYDFTCLDRALDAAERHGISVIVGTPTYAIPPWLARMDPTILAITGKGQNRYGTRQNMDITNPTYRKYAEGVIRAMVAHTAHRNHVIGFQIDNETKFYDVAGPRIHDMFREYLKKRFSTPEEMNDAFLLHYWSNAVHDWADLPDATGTINAGYAIAFDTFRRTLAADFLRWQSNIVKEYIREDQFITQNFDFEWKKFGSPNTQEGYSWGVQSGINHFEAQDAVTLLGVDIYHNTQDQLSGMTIAFGGDEMYALRHQNYLVLETQAQAFSSWLPYPGQLRLQGYSHLASGAMGLMYWNWHSIHNGFETYWRGILSHDLSPNPTYEEAARLGRELSDHSETFSGFSRTNRVALIISNTAMTALHWFPTHEDLSYNDIVLWMYDALYRRNIGCDVIFDQEADWSRYDVLVIPALYTASEDFIARVREFIAKGGTIFSGFRSFVANLDASVYHDAQPHGLTDCFGMTYNQFTKPSSVTVNGASPAYWMELLRPTTAESVLSYNHPYWGNYTALTKNTFGKGKAWYLGCDLPRDMLGDLLVDVMKEAGIPVPEQQFPVILRNGTNKKGETLTFILHYSSKEGSAVCPHDGLDLLTGNTYKKGDTIPLSDWNVVILRKSDT